MTSGWFRAAICTFSVFLLCPIQGCYSPQIIARSDPSRLARISTGRLCHSLTTQERNDEDIRAELSRRAVFTDREMQAIDQSKIFVGMTMQAYECSWTLPWYGNFVARRVVGYQEEIEGQQRAVFEYSGRVMYQESLPCKPPMTVYFEDDVVVGFLEGGLPDEESRFDFESARWVEGSDCAFLPEN